ncbi:DNA mismatch repair endonuclease MutL [Methanolobus sp. ZRKC2]|uniref:DNA mismatch repair endonuclease MutL n=1 Tax=Methanolobus sp. ZRKC2 TaxID=3125783 RepID=UPI003253CFAA
MTEESCDISGSRIKLLDESTINKIAAGEVVERPASVVKELLDNSIDAHATDVRVETRGSGTKNITVVDNGVGMSHNDASLAFQKHATSKINTIEDLNRVLTLGFRGEALASISSVAKVEMITRQEKDISGTKVVVDSSGLKSISSAGSPVGTSILVEDLFYTTPARRKYLKSMRTELAHITDVVTRHAISYPDISFTLINDGKVILKSPSSRDLLDSIVHLYGADVARSLVPLEFKSDLISISGYISKPELTRSGNDLQAFFINSRSISSKLISNAVRLGYYTLLPKGRYPAAFLKFTINPINVDVNVHPTKREVRLSHEKEIESAIISAVEKALALTNLVPEARITKKESGIQSRIFEAGKSEFPVEENKVGTPKEAYFSRSRIDEKTPDIEKEEDTEVVRETREPYHYPRKDTQKRLKKSERLQLQHEIQDDSPAKHPFNADDIKIYGQFADLYLIIETEEKLVMVDQHAAHERIMYEQVLKMKDLGWQELITPVTLDLSTKEKTIIEDYIPSLEKMGFAISEFGPNSYVVTTIPSIFGKLEDPSVIHDIISDLLSQGRIKEDTEVYDRLCSTMACRAAIKAGAVCTPEQMRELVRQLMLCENPYTCPHGRPTMLSFTKEELGRMFGRSS